jgi:hypothetical protein
MARGWRCKCGGYNTASNPSCRDCGGPKSGPRAVVMPASDELPLPLDAPQLTKAERLEIIEKMIRHLTLSPREVPIGGCSRHPDGCGRSGVAWDRTQAEMARRREEPDEPDW